MDPPNGAAGQTSAVVLVIDDDPQVRQVIRLALEEEGLIVAAAMNGAQPLRLAAELPPALVVLDAGLPDASGPTIADELRVARPGLPVLLITADGNAAEKAARLGAYAYLPKPFDIGDLIASVRGGLRTGR